MSNVNYPPNSNNQLVNRLQNTYSINTHSYPPRFPMNQGYNNNNFGRSSMGSNSFPQMQNMNASPFGNFRGQTTNTGSHSNWSNFDINKNSNASTNPGSNDNTAFRQPQPLIDRPLYNNPGHLLHNNVAPTVLNERIMEYRINIDSTDRDTTAYPDPFHYKVRFNAPSSRPDKDGVVFQGAPAPHISRQFRNVKYVKIDQLTLPQYRVTTDGTTIDTGTTPLIDDRFILLSIRELNNTFTLGTNKSIEDSFASIFPDSIVGTKFYYGTPIYNSKLYRDSLLGNLTTLTIDFKDSLGNDLTIDGLDPASTTITDAEHPLFRGFQNFMTLIIGVVESELNTDTQFAR